MEINQSRHGKSDEQKLWSSADDPQQWSSSGIVRLYTCSFCRKGFSNAQALGGHMNIHRKDRAKLREALDDENLLSLNSMNQADDDRGGDRDRDHPYRHDHVSEDKNNLVPLESSEEGSCIPKTPCSLTIEDDDASTLPADIKIANFVDEEDDDKKKLQSVHGSTQMELDLELRLGPEPTEISSSPSTKSAATTREFF